MKNKIKLSIILVNWNCGQTIINCIKSLYTHIKDVEYEIIVIDNNSTDGSKEYIKKNFPLVVLIENNYNNFFAGANNQGYSVARGKYILILNSDTVVFDDSIQKILNFFRQNAKLGALTCKLLNLDGTVQYYMHRRFPDYFRLIFSYIHKKFNFFKPTIIKNYLYLNNKFDKNFFIEQAAGVFILTKKSVIEDVGGLFDEEKFPLFYNDVDFCYRLSKKSKKILCLCNYSIFHLKARSTGKLNFFKSGQFYAPASLWYFKKHNKKFDFIILKISFLFLFVTLNIIKLIQFLMGKINKDILIENWKFLKLLFYF